MWVVGEWEVWAVVVWCGGGRGEGGVAWRCWHLVESTRDDLIFVKRRLGSLDT